MADRHYALCDRELAEQRLSGARLRECHGAEQAAQHVLSRKQLAGAYRWQGELCTAGSTAGAQPVYGESLHRDREQTCTGVQQLQPIAREQHRQLRSDGGPQRRRHHTRNAGIYVLGGRVPGHPFGVHDST